jgi:streptogramin lyase
VKYKSKAKSLALIAVVISFAIATIHPSHALAHALPADDSYSYQLVENWAQLPAGTQWGVMSAVDVDAKGNIYVLQRSDPTSKVIVFDSKGNYLKTWGEGEFPSAHTLRIIDGFVWITDRKLQQVFKFDTDGKLLLTLGQKEVAGDNNSEDSFNGTSDVAIGKNGDIFVSDGEGPNTRVVKFSKDGKFIKFWGTKGSGPGEFSVPHNIAIDSKGRVWVCDRGNKRLQVFDQDGKILDQTTQFGAASTIFITKDDVMYVTSQPPTNQIIIGTTDGKILGTIEGLNNAQGLAVDANGSVYVSESDGKAVVKFVKK